MWQTYRTTNPKQKNNGNTRYVVSDKHQKPIAIFGGTKATLHRLLTPVDYKGARLLSPSRGSAELALDDSKVLLHRVVPYLSG